MTATALTLTCPRKPWGVFSSCSVHDECLEACRGRLYRYVLAWPTGLDNELYALFILANPSTATPSDTDPTVDRCIDYAKRWGYGWARVVNVRAWRETNPKLVPADDDRAIGFSNGGHIVEQAHFAEIIICGWGKLGGTAGLRCLQLLHDECFEPHALKLNKDGSPQHPLYLRADAIPFPLEARSA